MEYFHLVEDGVASVPIFVFSWQRVSDAMVRSLLAPSGLERQTHALIAVGQWHNIRRPATRTRNFTGISFSVNRPLGWGWKAYLIFIDLQDFSRSAPVVKGVHHKAVH